jgi:hypothetical protein
MATVVEELVSTLGLEIDERTYTRAQQLVLGIRSGILGLGAALAGAVVGMGALVQGTANAAVQARRLSEATGMSAQTFQELGYAASSVGVDANSLRSVFIALSERALGASKGVGEYSETFSKLGVRVRDASGQLKSSDVLFKEIADAFQRMPAGVAKSAAASKLFGEQGAKLLPVLNSGSAGLQALAEDARALGVVLGPEAIEAADRYDTATGRVVAAMAGLRNAIGGPLITTFAELAEGLVRVVTGLRDIVAVPIVKSFKGLVAIGRSLRDNLWLVRFAVLAAAAAWGVHALTTMAASGSLLTLLGWYVAVGIGAVVSAAQAAAAWLLAAAPFIALGLLIAVIVDELYNFVTGGETMLGRLLKYLDKFNPDDSPFIELLKSAGSLLFDLTDPAKWERLSTAIKLFALKPIQALAGMIAKAAAAIPGMGGVADTMRLVEQGTGFAARLASPSAGFSPAAASPAGTVANSTQSSTSTNSASMDATINVTVAPGTDAHGTARATADAVREAWNTDMREAYIGVGQ